MINKIVGYSSFKSYAEQPYSTSKPGKQLERQNKVWESTVRDVDHVKPLQNYHNSKTVYKGSFLENTNPANYHPQHVPKGGAKTLDFAGTGTIKAYDREEAKRYGGTTASGGDERKNRMLKTGTEHWGSVYNQQMSKDSLDGFGTQKGLSGTGFGRSCSVNSKVKTPHQLAQEQARAKSYKNNPYINNAKIGQTDYRFNFGQKIGSTPMDLMNRVSYKQPMRDHPLKRGTNQLWSQIPNYQGFKPSELSFKEYQEKIGTRNQKNKGSVKLQTAENFLVHPPGYGGYKPQFQKEAPKLRQSCLSTGPAPQ